MPRISLPLGTGSRSRSSRSRSGTPMCTTRTPSTRPSPAGRVGSGRGGSAGRGRRQVCEFAAAELSGRLGVSTISAGMLMADGLDIVHRLPQLWARVEAGRVRVYLARLVARKTRDLTPEQAAYVDSRVTPYADGRLTWTRFQALVEGVVAAADPDATAERERKAAEQQLARKTRGEEGDHGLRGFYIRAPFATIAVFDAALARIADILADLGDTEAVDRRRVKALLILSRPDLAAELIAAYQAWRDRPDDPTDLPDLPDLPDVVSTSSTDQTTDQATLARTGATPVIDWKTLLPAVTVYVHLYAGIDADGIARIEKCGAMTEAWVRDHLSPHANVTVKPVLDLAGQAPVDGYEIPERHRRAVHLMTPADTFPYATSLDPAQIDHTEPFVHGHEATGAGQSRIGNYGPHVDPPPPPQDPRPMEGQATLPRHLPLARPPRRLLPRRPHRHPHPDPSRLSLGPTNGICRSGVHHIDAHRLGVRDRGLQHGPTRVRDGQPGSGHGQPAQPRVGEDLVDRRMVAAGHHGHARAAEDPRRVLGGRLVSLARLVVAPPGEPLLALAAGLGPALHVALADLVLDHVSPASRATAKPPLRTSSTPHRSGAATAAAKAAASAGPSYDVSKGSRAMNVEPSAARPASAPSRPRASVSPCRWAKFSTQRSTRAAGTRTSARRRHAPGDAGTLGPQVEALAADLVAPVPQGEVERDRRAAQYDVGLLVTEPARRDRSRRLTATSQRSSASSGSTAIVIGSSARTCECGRGRKPVSSSSMPSRATSGPIQVSAARG